LWAAAIAGCVREYPADHWLPGVRCDDGVCLNEWPDRRSTTFWLAPDCWLTEASKAEAGISADRMTLTGAGDEIVFAAMDTTDTSGDSSTAPIATALFAAGVGSDGACPQIDWPVLARPVKVANGAHVVGPGGKFWSFAGDVGGTTDAMAYDRASGWVHYSVAAPAPPLIDPRNWNAPNAMAIALPASGVAIVRSVVSNGTQVDDHIPTLLERWAFASDRAPTWIGQTQVLWGAPGYNAIQSTRGQVRLFSVGACSPTTQDGPADHLIALGDIGRALPLLGDDLTPAPIISERTADADVNQPNFGSTSVLLPLRRGSTYAPGSVLFIGGGTDGDQDPERAQRLDLFDPACGTWTEAGRILPRGRTFATPVLLPDGNILLAGDLHGAHDVLYIDPQHDFRVTVGHDNLLRTRSLGVGGLVLADGKVVLAGGKDPDGDDQLAPDIDLWEPPYLHAGPPASQPTIVPPSKPILIDGPFSIEMATGSPEITEVVLLAFGSSFMGNNPNQRLVELEIDRDRSDPLSGRIALNAPPAGWTPAGRYLLFALTADRIPSLGIPVDVVDSAASP
jgi:hypothetical protein